MTINSLSPNIQGHLENLAKDHEAYKYTNLLNFFGQMDYSEKSSPSKTDASEFEEMIFSNNKFSTSAPIEIIEEADVNSLSNKKFIIKFNGKTKFERPIRVRYEQNSSDFSLPNLEIHVGKFSELTFIEEFNHHATIGTTVFHIEDGAQVEHLQISNLSEDSVKLATAKAYLKRDSNYRNVAINLKGRLNRNNSETHILEAGANGESYLLYLTENTEHSDFNTVIHHFAADTTSNQIAKGILGGNSKGIFTGKIHIHPDAQRVASGQLNKNLLLSQKAQCFSQPQLEIFADDVKCSHGSTTGQLSDDEVFYFESRGIPAEKAKTLLALGFALEIVLKIKNLDARSFIEKEVRRALQDKFKLGADL